MSQRRFGEFPPCLLKGWNSPNPRGDDALETVEKQALPLSCREHKRMSVLCHVRRGRVGCVSCTRTNRSGSRAENVRASRVGRNVRARRHRDNEKARRGGCYENGRGGNVVVNKTLVIKCLKLHSLCWLSCFILSYGLFKY